MKKVLVVLTNTARYAKSQEPTGLWLGEAAEFVASMMAANVAVDYVSPQGGFVPLDPRSLKYTNDRIMAVYEDSDFQKRALSSSLQPEEIDPREYCAIYYTGGHGVMWDFPDNKALQQIALAIYQQGGYLTSVCHGIAGLLNIQDKTGNYLIKDRHITGFTTMEEILAGKKGIVPFLNQPVAVAHGAYFVKKRAYRNHALQDQQLITGQNPFSVESVAQLLLAAIQKS